MRVVIADDEPLARDRLRALLAEQPGTEVVAEAADGEAALHACADLKPDLVLLDIAMPGIDGLEAARHLAAFEPRPAVVFCTAYDAHALSAFDAQAIDYLVKPVRSERLAAALERVRTFAAGREHGVSASGQRRTHLCARIRGSLRLILRAHPPQLPRGPARDRRTQARPRRPRAGGAAPRPGAAGSQPPLRVRAAGDGEASVNHSLPFA